MALSETRLEPELEELLWPTVNLFHRATSRIERELDDNRGAETQPAGPGYPRIPLGRTRTPNRRRPDADRTPELPGILSRPGRRQVRAPRQLGLAPSPRIDVLSPHNDVGHDRQLRFSRRQAPGSDQGIGSGLLKNRLHWRPRLQRPPPDPGQARPRSAVMVDSAQ